MKMAGLTVADMEAFGKGAIRMEADDVSRAESDPISDPAAGLPVEDLLAPATLPQAAVSIRSVVRSPPAAAVLAVAIRRALRSTTSMPS